MTRNPPESATQMTFAARAERYARQVLDGTVLAGRWAKAAAQRHLDDLERAEAGDAAFPWVFDPEKAGRPCHFLQCLPHIEGKWAKPVLVDGRWRRPTIVLEDWQVFWIAVAFGWVHRETGLRRFRRAYLRVGRKNAKSTLCAGLALYLLGADGEQGAQVYSAATKKDQAKIVWGVAQKMVSVEPEFADLDIGYNQRAIFQDKTASRYEPLGRDSDTQDGLNVHAFIADELHAWSDRGLYDVLDSATGAREQPLGIGITTAGYETGGICAEQDSYLKKILNAVLLRYEGLGYRIEGESAEDDQFFGVIYELDVGYADGRSDDDWADPAVWVKANPNLGVSASLEDLEAKCRRAIVMPGARAEFRTKHCNQWLSADSAWMDMAKWDACADPTLSLEDFAGEDCWTGLDAAFKTDFFSKLRVFRRGDDYYALGDHWLPEAKVDARESPLFWEWAEAGRIHVAPGEVTDIELVRASLNDDRARFNLREVPFDPAQLTQFASEALEDGFPMIEMRPTVLNFSEPMKKLAELVLTGHFHHNGCQVLRWMVANVVCHHDAKDNIYPRKPEGEGEKRKIDGVIALIMAVGRAMLAAPDNVIGSDYQVMSV